MIGYKDFVSVFNMLKNKNLGVISKRVRQVLKEDGLRGVAAKIRVNRPLNFKYKVFNGKDQDSFSSLDFRYLYVKISSQFFCKISLSWQAGDRVYETGDFYIQRGSILYEFDFAFIRAKAIDSQNNEGYFSGGVISQLEIRCDKDIVVEFSKLSAENAYFENGTHQIVKMMEYPKIIHLEVTRKCNLRCYMCREDREEDVKEIGTCDLSPQIFQKMIPFIQNTGHLALFGWGEPLCHKNFKEFIDIVGCIKKRNRAILKTGDLYLRPFTNFTTNGYLMDKDLMQRLIRNDIDEVVFSIDSPNKDNYAFIRKGSEFNKVIDNIRMLQELKSKHKVSRPALIIEFVAMRRNIEELPDMVKLAVSLGVQRLFVISIVVVTKGLEQESLYYHQDLANKFFDLAENLAKEMGISIVLPNRFGTKSSPQGYCDDVHNIFYVKAEGTAIPCCVATNNVIGDLNCEDPYDIWKGSIRKEFIDDLKNGNLKSQCRTCYKFTGTDLNLRSTHIKI